PPPRARPGWRGRASRRCPARSPGPASRAVSQREAKVVSSPATRRRSGARLVERPLLFALADELRSRRAALALVSLRHALREPPRRWTDLVAAARALRKA